MKPGLQLRLSQHLTLTPQLQQSIRLLQLSTLELNQEIEEVLAENPFLERIDHPLDDSLHIAADGSLKESHTFSNSSDSSNFSRETSEHQSSPSSEELPYESNANQAYDWSNPASGHKAFDDDREPDVLQLGAAPVTLREHLLTQLSLTKLSERDLGLVRALIELIDEDGYLRHELGEILQLFPAELAIEHAELETALHFLQSFDPAGVSARNASECLTLQLNHLTREIAANFDDTIIKLARRIVIEHLDVLAAHDFNRLKKLLGCDIAALGAAHRLISQLVPYPGRSFAVTQINYIAADVIVKKVNHQWCVSLNQQVIPQLRVNQIYAQVLREQRGNSQTSSLSTRLQEAKWLIKNIQQRFETILRVSEAIVERQRNFFNHGAVAMRPLVLREIADRLGLHESTISRVTTNKYMLTPFGTFELKYFFGSHVTTESGGAASSTAIRALIQQLIGAENPKKPLSDNKIAALLAQQGITVARRTIAKYREILRIPPTSLRKSL